MGEATRHGGVCSEQSICNSRENEAMCVRMVSTIVSTNNSQLYISHLASPK